MENELLDLSAYSAHKNFNFFEYRYSMTEKRKEQFLTNCQKVLECDHARVRETFRLAVRLAELKESGEWGGVVDPDSGKTFYHSSFEAFCKHAFDFGKTKTSNLLSIAKFCWIDENDSLVFIAEKYQRMNSSKLIELAPVTDWVREYFTPEMSVQEMRMCKRYANSGQFYIDKEKEGFNILACAQQWTDNLKRRKEREEVDAITAELQRVAQTEENSSDETEYFHFPVQTSELEEVEEVVPTSELYPGNEHRFSTRAQVRKFLARYTEWCYLGLGNFFEKIYRYRFKNGMELFAATCKMCVNVTEGEDKELLFFFLGLGGGAQPIKIAKNKLEVFLRANESELLGGL